MMLPHEKNHFSQRGKAIDTRPTIVAKDEMRPSPRDRHDMGADARKRSPLKKMVDKMFGRSPDKKKVGTITHQVVEPIQ